LFVGPPRDHDPLDPPPPGGGELGVWFGNYWTFDVTVTAPGATDTVAVYLWGSDFWAEAVMPEPIPSGAIVVEGAELSVDWSIGLTGAYRRARITENYPSSQRLRHPAQRTGEGHWFANDDTIVSVSATVAGQSLEASGNYGAVGEFDLTESLSLGISSFIGYNYAPVVDTPYGSITVNLGADDEVGVDFTGWSFYKDTDNSDWHWHGSGDEPPAAANIDWYTYPSSNTVDLRRGQHTDAYTGVTWSELGISNAVKVIPTLYKNNDERTGTSGGIGIERYTSYDTSAGHPFEIGLYRQEGQTAADVSVAPSWDGYTFVEFWSYGVPIPDRIWRKFTNMLNGITFSLRADWLIANNEDVVFTLPSDTTDVPRVEDGVTYPLVDILQMCTMHPLDGDLTASPFRTGWIDWTREELNLDKPNGTNRPSEWVGGTGVTVSGDDLIVSAAGGELYRIFKSRYPNRIRRMNAHLWTGTGDRQQVKHEWLLMTRHDLPIEITEDDPRWWDPNIEPWPGDDPGILYEDVTDWRAISAVQLAVSGATEDQNLVLRISYQTLSGSDPNYLGARFNFGVGDGEFEAVWSDVKIWTVSGVLDSSTGLCKFDLAPDSGGSAPDLKYVSKIEILFPETSAEQHLTLIAFSTVPAVGTGNGSIVNRISPKHSTDYFGGRMYTDGIWNYQPTYLYNKDIERGEVGFKHTRPQQHPPTYEGPDDDPTYLKTLAEYFNEVYWGETIWRPTWNQSVIDASLKDADENVLGTPLFPDMGDGEFVLHIGRDLDVFFPYHVVECRAILQGGARGIVKSGGVRDTGGTEVSLYYSDDNGVTKTHVQTVETFEDGSFRVWPGREKSPRIFYLRIGDTYYKLGHFYNQEEVWYGSNVLSLADLFLYINKFGNFYRVYETGGKVMIRSSYGLKPVKPAVTVGSVSGNVVNVYCWNDGQKLVVGAQNEDGTETLWVSENEDIGPFIEVV